MTQDSIGWYLNTVQGQAGPFSSEEIKRRLAAKEITTEFYVWREGMAEWTMIADLPDSELATLILAAPPKSPPPPQASVKRKAGQRIAAALAILLLLAGVAAAGWYGYENYFLKPLHPGTLVPAGALLYSEASFWNIGPAETERFRKYFELFAEEKDLKGFSLDKAGYRLATGFYAPASSQGEWEFLAAIRWKDEPGAREGLEKKLLDRLKISGEKMKEEEGWLVGTGQTKFVSKLLIATRGDYRLLSNSEPRLKAAMKLWREEKGASMANSAEYARFVGKADPEFETDRMFLDIPKGLAAIEEKMPPVAAAFFGKAREALQGAGFLVGSGTRTASGYKSQNRVIFEGREEFLAKWGEGRIHWPEPAKGDEFTFAVAPPPGWSEPLKPFLEKMKSRSSGGLGKIMGDIGAINGALAMFFADNEGKYPRAKKPLPLSKIGIAPNYIEPPLTPWGDEFQYQETKNGYRLAALKDGKPVVWYESEKGIVESQENAEEILAASEPPPPDFDSILSSVREFGSSVSLGSGFPLSFKSKMGVRFSESAEAEKARAAIPTPPGGLQQGLKADGEWLLFRVDALGGSTEPDPIPASEGIPAIFIADGRLSLSKFSKILPLGKEKAIPTEEWHWNVKGAIEKNEIVLDGMIEPDPTPVSFALNIAQFLSDKEGGIFGKPGAAFPGRPGGPPRPLPQRPSRAPRGEMDEDPIIIEEMGRNQAALSAGIY